MINLVSSAIAGISSLLNVFQVKRFLAVALVGFLVLTTNVDHGSNKQASNNGDRDTLHEIDSVRPKTTNEWYEEARETEGKPGDRFKNIAEESGQAFKELGSLYPDTAKRSANALKDDTASTSRSSSK